MLYGESCFLHLTQSLLEEQQAADVQRLGTRSRSVLLVAGTDWILTYYIFSM